MSIQIKGATRFLNLCIRTIAIGLIAFAINAPGTAAQAQTQVSLQSSPLVVRNDRGGLLRERMRELSQLQQTNRPVQISGSICYSTCTMFLGLPQTCISPNTTFGFHGPSSYGRALDPDTFNRASRIISRNYPPALKRWYMETARFRIRGLYKVTGAQIVAMGHRAC